MDENRLNEIKGRVAFFKQRKQVAEKMIDESSKKGWFFAICGLPEGLENINDDLVQFRVVKSPPLLTELASTLENKNVFERVAFYSNSTTYELQIIVKTEEPQLAKYIAYNIIAMIRIRSGVEFLVPMASNYSWSIIPGAPDNSVKTMMLEDYPQAKIFNKDKTISQDDMKWVIEHYYDFIIFSSDNPQLCIAIDSLSTFNQQESPRMCIAALWAGIEAVFGIQSELRFRLAAEISAYLKPRGVDRVSLHNRIKQLYDFRSKAVHGSKINDASIKDHISEVQTLLRQILIKCINERHIPTKKEFEDLIHL